MLRFSGCKQLFFEGLMDSRYIRVEELCVADVSLKKIMSFTGGAGFLLFGQRKSGLLLGRAPTLKFLPHSCNLFEIFCPSFGGLVPTDLPRAPYNQAIRNRFAAVWTFEHECSLEMTCCFVNRESIIRCEGSAKQK